MNKLKAYAEDQVATIIQPFDNLELRATVSDTSYSVEFFVAVNGVRKQCYELVDDGMIDEAELDRVLSSIANYIRNDAGYKAGSVNKISF